MKISQATRPKKRKYEYTVCIWIVELWQLCDETCRSCDNIVAVTATMTTANSNNGDKTIHLRYIPHKRCVCERACFVCQSVNQLMMKIDFMRLRLLNVQV